MYSRAACHRLGLGGLVLSALLWLALLSAPVLAAAGQTGDTVQGPKVVNITVTGNQYIPADTILKAVTHTKVGAPVTKEMLQADLQSIGALGLFSDVSVQVKPVSGGADVVFEVKENPVVSGERFVPIGFTLPAGADSVLQSFPVKKGTVLNTNQLKEGVQTALKDLYEKYGVVARVSDVQMDKQQELLILLLPTRVGQITVSGNKKTKDYVILREMTLKPGDVLNTNVLGSDLRKVLNLGFFDEVHSEFRDTGNPDVVNINIDVKERPTGTASGGVSYSTADGLVGFIDVSDQNAFGRGDAASLRWEFGAKKNSYNLGFTEPYLLGRPNSLSLNLYDQRQKRTYDSVDYDEATKGGSVQFGTPLAPDTRGYVTIKAENAENTPLVPGTTLPDSFGPTSSRTRSLTFAVIKDTRDFVLKPSAGGVNKVSLELALPVLGGDTNFQKLSGEMTRFAKAGPGGQVWALRLSGGVISGNAPLSDQFYVGGADSVRGYRYGEFVGTKMFLGNLEYRFNIIKGLQGALFVDAGNAWQKDQLVQPLDLHVGAGLGVRIETPIGVFRLDYGVGQKGGQPYFSLGQTF